MHIPTDPKLVSKLVNVEYYDTHNIHDDIDIDDGNDPGIPHRLCSRRLCITPEP